MSEREITLHVVIRPDGDHISGQVGTDTGATRAFSGRLGLLGAIDALVARDAIASTHSVKEQPE